jgi:hypothetical protein
MTTPVRHHPVHPPASTGFGFEAQMRSPVYGFRGWHDRASLLATQTPPVRRTRSGPAA